MGERRAVATLADQGQAVSLEFHFNAADEISGVYAEGRYCRESGDFVTRAWEGRFGDYALRYGEMGGTAKAVGNVSGKGG